MYSLHSFPNSMENFSVEIDTSNTKALTFSTWRFVKSFPCSWKVEHIKTFHFMKYLDFWMNPNSLWAMSYVVVINLYVRHLSLYNSLTIDISHLNWIFIRLRIKLTPHVQKSKSMQILKKESSPQFEALQSFFSPRVTTNCTFKRITNRLI